MTTIDIPHATDRLPAWRDLWQRAGRLVLLLDFDGTLAPIVSRPEEAALPPETSAALHRLRRIQTLDMAVVSGRGLADARERVGIEGIAYAGNHGMEIEGPELRRVHPEAEAARPLLAGVAARLQAEVGDIEGVLVEDKILTLSIHYRRAERSRVEEVRAAVREAVRGEEGLRITEGKELLEVRPAVDWHKGRATEFLLNQLSPSPGTPAIFIGDDRTDEDAFRALLAMPRVTGEGVIVGDPPPADTLARSYLRGPAEVGRFLTALAELAER